MWRADSAATRENLLSSSLHHILDGGSMLHKASWPRGITYRQIAEMNVNYAQTQYASSTVVFDAYALSKTTKDSAHAWRRLRSSSDVEISPGAFLGQTKDLFLSNNNKKRNFIKTLSTKLSQANIIVFHAKSDFNRSADSAVRNVT
ncbi:hypothetical protein ElyMa_005041500 [Elysia marginata]|uniref:RNase H type-1 domain-containing protein n=1 Tax=Elysia marginata TaxID=1093978 RepID=A0AAV4JAV2_9GAST|nr:hypothetical protein ElyMa_005041500 [Elysia marginata]